MTLDPRRARDPFGAAGPSRAGPGRGLSAAQPDLSGRAVEPARAGLGPGADTVRPMEG
jgi:hypothetical protein